MENFKRTNSSYRKAKRAFCLESQDEYSKFVKEDTSCAIPKREVNKEIRRLSTSWSGIIYTDVVI